VTLINGEGRRFWLSGVLADREGIRPKKSPAGQGGKTKGMAHYCPPQNPTGFRGGTGCRQAGKDSNCLQCPFEKCVEPDIRDWIGYGCKEGEL